MGHVRREQRSTYLNDVINFPINRYFINCMRKLILTSFPLCTKTRNLFITTTCSEDYLRAQLMRSTSDEAVHSKSEDLVRINLQLSAASAALSKTNVCDMNPRTETPSAAATTVITATTATTATATGEGEATTTAAAAAAPPRRRSTSRGRSASLPRPCRRSRRPATRRRDRPTRYVARKKME